MKTRPSFHLLNAVILLAVSAGLHFQVMFASNPNPDSTSTSNTDLKKIIAEVSQLNKDGNYQEAYEKALAVLHTPPGGGNVSESHPKDVVQLLHFAYSAANQLHRNSTFLDDFLHKSIAAHPDNWRLLQQCATFLLNSGASMGSLVDGQYQRGIWTGTPLSSQQRDRVQSLQWMRKATVMALQDPHATANERAQQLIAEANQYGNNTPWQLQVLTGLDSLPEYEPVEGGGGFRGRGVMWARPQEDPGYPVDAEGKPVFFKVPDAWENAVNDGERYRYLMDLAIKTDPSFAPNIQHQLAHRFSSWFDVGTIQDPQLLSRMQSVSNDSQSSDFKQSLLNLSTLAENETITKFATGVKRHTLPEEFNYLGILKEVGNSSANVAAEALTLRATLLQNRRQLVAAAETWQQLLDRFGNVDQFKKMAERHLQQIRGNLGQLSFPGTQPSGEPASVSLRFRNASKVDFKATRILVDKIHGHLIKSLRDQADGKTIKHGDWHWLNQAFNSLFQYHIAISNEQLQQFIESKPVAEWSHDLQPAAGHADRIVDLPTPLRDAGFYLVEASFPDGNTTRIIVELADLMIITKNKQGEATQMGFVLDAVTGKPIANATINAIGHRTRFRESRTTPKRDFLVREQKLSTDASGYFEITESNSKEPYQWLLQVSAPDGRKAWLGLSHVFQNWSHPQDDHNEHKIFLVSDRPVYRPGQPVHLNAWARRATYHEERSSNEFAGKPFVCHVSDPRGETIFKENGKLDENGAASLTFHLDPNATLGEYHVEWHVHNMVVTGRLNLRVEEYKKPEFEVLVHTPDVPVQLGESFQATIEAKYYFGSPVTNAQVHYKVERTIHDNQWFPVRPWDWLYGSGYWWRNSEYVWLPDHHRCIIHRPSWWPSRQDPPEVIAQGTVNIGADGKVLIPIDTALAKELHGDKDHSYKITAEVVDSSRRMIVGTGQVIAPRDPFKVYVWMDRGFYETGKEAVVSLTARDPLSNKVTGKAKLRVLELTYQKNAEAPTETQVAEYELDVTADQEEFQQSLQFPKAGQYRIAVEFTDVRNRTVTGSVNTTVRGPNFQKDSKQYRFPELEVIAEKESYTPGENAVININTDQEGATLLVFDRPDRGTYHKPAVILIADGKSTVHTLPIATADQPNIFVEVITVHKAQLHRKMVQIPVPPAKRIADVELDPSSDTYTPQQDGTVQIKVTDIQGNPIHGQVLITAYDKALEYISGGSNLPEIRDFFWGWKREHHPTGLDSLNVIRPFQDNQGIRLEPIGIFGHHLDELEDLNGSGMIQLKGGMDAGRALYRTRTAVADSQPMPMAAAAPAPMVEKAVNGAQSFSTEDQPGEAAPMLREDFADLLFWKAGVSTNEQGVAKVPFKTTDDLTTWKIRTWTLGPNNEVGEATVEIITRKNLLVRLQAPRFFVEKDEVVISGIVHNELQEAQDVRAILELEGGTLAPLEGVSLEQKGRIESGGEQRFDWRVKVQQEGEAKIRIKALAAIESDAVEKTFPVYVHGMERTEAWSLAIRPDQAEAAFTIQVPEKRRPAQTHLEIRYSPSLAASMVDALPFLISYPHGCTEQTLNRFVPTVITHKILRDLGLDLKTIKQKRVNFNAQEIGEPKLRSAQLQRWRDQEPVFDDKELQKIVKSGIDRLQSMQAEDGGWGWWPGASTGSPHLTAQLVEGLLHAQNANAPIPNEMIERGKEWLIHYENGQLHRLRTGKEDPQHKSQPDNLDALVHSVLVSSGLGDDEMRQRLYDSRLSLSKAMQARLGLACHAREETERRDMIIRNLEQFQKTDDANQTAWLDFGNQHSWWYWYDDEIETLAAYLQLRIARDPKDPVAPSLVKYLLNNRKNGTYWRSTRDTAAALLALATYMKQTGETEMDMLVEIWVDGKKLKEAPINKENLFTYDHSLVLSGSELTTGEHRIEIKRKGKGTLYANAYLSCFILEDHLAAAGLEVQVQRKLYRLIPEETRNVAAGSRGQALQQKGERHRREPIADDAQLQSGDLIEVELLVESKNDYEYLMLEDFKPAGCEAVELQSGYYWQSRLHPYREFRDQKVTHFMERLPRGKHSLTYQLRAEIPGRFSAMPSIISGMYAPELKGNAEEIRVKVVDTNP